MTIHKSFAVACVLILGAATEMSAQTSRSGTGRTVPATNQQDTSRSNTSRNNQSGIGTDSARYQSRDGLNRTTDPLNGEYSPPDPTRGTPTTPTTPTTNPNTVPTMPTTPGNPPTTTPPGSPGSPMTPGNTTTPPGRP